MVNPVVFIPPTILLVAAKCTVAAVVDVIPTALFIEFENETVEINEGEMIVVPIGTKHKPYAKKEAKIMLVEPAGVVNTGDNEGELTAPNDQWI